MPQRHDDRITAALGAGVRSVAPLAGGCVGDVSRITLDDGRTVVAKADDGPDPKLDVEGRMLRLLAERSDLPVPEVLHESPSLLVMAFIDADGRGGPSAEEHAADLLAALHGVSPPDGRFGLDFDTLIGGLHQPNPPAESWLDFFADHRLREMARQAHDHGRLPADTRSRIDALCARLDRWIAEPDAPSLIHGDAWGGNVLYDNGRVAALIDPAVYYADPEIELAFTTLFGTFGSAFFDRYQDHRPIPEGFFEQRKDLYNLYPLLVHVRLFGGSYLGGVENTLRRFGV